MRGLYVHIPFCVRKCAYCDFYSVPVGSPAAPRRGGVSTPALESYVQSVLSEASAYAINVGPAPCGRPGDALAAPVQPFQTLYLGGGTPSLLGPGILKELITGLRQTFDLSAMIEASVEVNPESTTPDFLAAAKETGITRVSIGVQSLCDTELKSVGRIHDARRAIAAVKLALALGFRSVSADLVIGLPGQTPETLGKSLETLCDLGVQHLSVYCLSLEESTPLANHPPDDLPSDDVQADLFDYARSFLAERGFVHYEISNFAIRGHECLHNLNYWRGGEYLGLGPAAASHLKGKRLRNRANLDAYLINPTGQNEFVEELDFKEKAAEEAMLRLRLLREGLDIGELAAKFGTENIVDLVRRLEGLADRGLLSSDRENGRRVNGSTGAPACESPSRASRQGAAPLTTPDRTEAVAPRPVGVSFAHSTYRLPPHRVLTSNPIFAEVLDT